MEKSLKVMPAIYRLRMPDLVHWGWHRLSELTEVVNNLFKEQKLPEITPEELVREFFDLKTGLPFTWHDGDYKRGGQREHIREEMNFSKENYVSAGWGVAVVKAVERGVVRVSLTHKSGKPSIIGYNRLNLPIRVIDLAKGKKYTHKEFGVA